MREANAVATHCDRSSGGIENSFGSHVAYREAVGCPLYLGTRPDIVFAVSRAARAMDRPTEAVWICQTCRQVFAGNEQLWLAVRSLQH